MNQALVNISSHQEMAEFANELKKFIVSQQLFTNIQGKNYVNVEGWEYAGAATGILPVVKSVEDLSTDEEIRYKATVELIRVSDSSVVGGGIAICSSRESKRANAEEYVIASMAQTRAIGKAYRNLFGWLMKMAGYQPTPAEDMEATVSTPEGSDPDIYDRLIDAKSKTELQAIIAKLSASELKTYVETIAQKNKELSGVAA